MITSRPPTRPPGSRPAIEGAAIGASPATARRRVRQRVHGSRTRRQGEHDIVNPTIVPTAGAFTAVGGDHVKGGASTNQGTAITTANHNPTLTAPAAKTIPIRTPFTLTGSATDSDSDTLIYLWEQNDAGREPALANAHLTGPLFRVFGKYANVTARTRCSTTRRARTWPRQPEQDLPGHRADRRQRDQRRDRCAPITETASLPDNAKLALPLGVPADATYTAVVA